MNIWKCLRYESLIWILYERKVLKNTWFVLNGVLRIPSKLKKKNLILKVIRWLQSKEQASMFRKEQGKYVFHPSETSPVWKGTTPPCWKWAGDGTGAGLFIYFHKTSFDTSPWSGDRALCGFAEQSSAAQGFPLAKEGAMGAHVKEHILPTVQIPFFLSCSSLEGKKNDWEWWEREDQQDDLNPAMVAACLALAPSLRNGGVFCVDFPVHTLAKHGTIPALGEWASCNVGLVWIGDGTVKQS